MKHVVIILMMRSSKNEMVGCQVLVVVIGRNVSYGWEFRMPFVSVTNVRKISEFSFCLPKIMRRVLFAV